MMLGTGYVLNKMKKFLEYLYNKLFCFQVSVGNRDIAIFSSASYNKGRIVTKKSLSLMTPLGRALVLSSPFGNS